MTVAKTPTLPVAVIGAGPVGLAAAAQLLGRGVDVVVLEAGTEAGAAIRTWGHTRLFSPWRYLVDDAAARILERDGWQRPEPQKLPTGHDYVDAYLAPLAATTELAPRIRYGSRVEAISRQGMDRTRTNGRAAAPFVVRTHATDGTARDVLARAVIDCSGTTETPNPILASGLPPATPDELPIVSGLPDVLGADRDRFAGRSVLVVGAGHSAANALLTLASLAKEAPGTSITWAIRAETPHRVFGSPNDELAARGQLGAAVHRLVETGAVTLAPSFEIDDVESSGDGVKVVGRQRGNPAVITADTVIAATGFRPDLSPLRELRLSLDEVVEAPVALAPLIDPNLHSCGTVSPHGVTELAHPEPSFFIAGMKSYGRAPTFLLVTGYEQVRSIADELAGNHDAARDVQLVLPETGVCSSDLPGDDGEPREAVDADDRAASCG